MYSYRCVINNIVDGDTIDIDLDLGFGIWLRNERVRVLGIDTPEKRTSDKIEKLFGLAASARVQELLPISSSCVLLSKEFKGKFGRILGDFMLPEGTLTEILVREHHAVLYEGQSKYDITDAHIRNRLILLESGVVSKEEYLKACAP